MAPLGRHVSRLSGFAPAVPTPFDESGAIDSTAFERFCEKQIDEGATALVVCGTTGEAPTLSPAEHSQLVRMAVAIVRGRVPVIAGAGSNSTAHAIELTKDAEALGADAVLSVVPYYNKPTQAGLHTHFGAIAQSTGLPIILYDVPSRTVCGLADDTIARLAEMPQIIGQQGRDRRSRSAGTAETARRNGLQTPLWRRRHGFGVSDSKRQRLHFRHLQRCPGCRGKWPGRNVLASPFAQLTAALFRESNPAPLKYALSLLGLMSPKVRLPLVELTDQTKTHLASILNLICDKYSDFMIGKICVPPRIGSLAVPVVRTTM